MKKKATSLLLAILLTLSLLPGFAMADGESGEEILAVIADGIRNWETRIDVRDYELKVEEVGAYFHSVINSHPEFFYVSECGYTKENYVMDLCPIYDKRFTEDDSKTFNSVCTSIIAPMPNGTTEEKLLYIHDYIVTHCQYDETYTKNTAYDCLVGGSSVCDGYSRAFLYLCQLARLEVHFIGSNALVHSWNAAKVSNSTSPSGAFYYIDCTWDDPMNYYNPSSCFHEYFLLNREALIGEQKEVFNLSTIPGDWVNEDGENIVSKYVSNEHYRNYWWTGLNRPVAWVGELMCYAKGNDRSHVFFRNSGATKETAIALPSNAGENGIACWYLWENNEGYYPESYITVASLNGDFYFSTPTQIWKLTTGETMSLVYTLTSIEKAKGYIYGLTSKEGNLVYYLSTDPQSAPVATGTLSLLAPAAPASVNAKAAAGKNNVSWNAVAGASKYKLQRREYGSAWSSWSNMATVIGTSYADKNVTAGTKYQYRVCAYNGQWSAYTKSASVIAISAVPAIPTNLKVTSTINGITVSWNAASGAAKYRVIRTVDGVTTKTKVTGTTWTDTEVEADKNYVYSVQAQSADGTYSAASEAKNLYYPLGIAVKVSGQKANVSWTPVAGATKYQMYRRPQVNGKYGDWELIYSAKGTSFVDTPGAGVWQYRVRAVVDGVKTAYSNRKRVTVG